MLILRFGCRLCRRRHGQWHALAQFVCPSGAAVIDVSSPQCLSRDVTLMSTLQSSYVACTAGLPGARHRHHADRAGAREDLGRQPGAVHGVVQLPHRHLQVQRAGVPVPNPHPGALLARHQVCWYLPAAAMSDRGTCCYFGSEAMLVPLARLTDTSQSSACLGPVARLS